MEKSRKKIYYMLICIGIIVTFIVISIIIYFNNKSNVESVDAIETIEILETENLDDENHKKIYLTFDDGPSKNIESLLDILDKYNAKATFFMVGKSVDERPYLARIVKERGHSIGMHSYSHSHKIYDSINSFKDDLSQCEKIFKEAIGFVPRLYRFPYGSHNKYLNEDKFKKISEELIKRGYNYYDWNVSTGDGSKTASGYDIYVNAINGIENEKNPVILMHDTNENTMAVIEFILQYGFMNRYKFEGLQKESPPVRYGP